MKFAIEGNYLNGKFFLPPISGPDSTEHFIEKKSPSNQKELLWKLPVDYQVVGPAVTAVSKGQERLRLLSFSERLNLIYRWQETLLAKREEIIHGLCAETGRPHWDVKEECDRLANLFAFAPRFVQSLGTENIIDEQNRIIRRALGPTLIIVPFSEPLALLIEQVIYTFLAGNASVVLPSEHTAYTTQLIFQALHLAQFPVGAVNLIQGPFEMTKRLAKEKIFKNILFTGSTDAAQFIQINFADSLQKRIHLILNSKNIAVVGGDMEVDTLVPHLLKAAYLSTGQRINSTGILLVAQSMVDQLIAKLHVGAKNLIIAGPFADGPSSFMGPFIDQKHLDDYLRYIGMAKREGIEEIMRGKQLQQEEPGLFVTPSIHYAPQFLSRSHFFNDHFFAPNVIIVPYERPEDALEITNQHPFGLITSVFTHNEATKTLFAEHCESGLIYFNNISTNLVAQLPFAGMKNSSNYAPAGLGIYESGQLKIAINDQTNQELPVLHLNGIATVDR